MPHTESREFDRFFSAVRRALSSVRWRLLCVMLAVLLPLAALIVYDAAGDRERAISNARAELQSLARLAVDDLDTRISGAQHLLSGLAEVPMVRNGVEPGCSELLAGILKQAARYNNVFVAGARGELVCGGLAAPRPVHYSDTEFFRRAVEERVPVVAKPTIGRITGRAVITVARPLLGAGGDVAGVLIAGLRLDWFGERYARALLVPGMVVVMWDEEGRILFRSPDAENLAGKQDPETPLVAAARLAKGNGVVEAAGFDGVRRIYALSTPAQLANLGVTFSMGVPVSVPAAPADQDLRRNLVALALLAVAGFALAWWIAERWVRRPMRRLVGASRLLRDGDLRVRVEGSLPGGELGELTAGFNEAAAALEEKDASLRRSNRALRMLSECNQALVRAGDEPGLLHAICERIVLHGGYRFAWVGYAVRDEAKSVQPAARAGIGPERIEALQVTWGDGPGGLGPTGSAIRTGEVFIADDIATDARIAPWREVALAHGYASCIGLPLRVEGQPIGALTICSAERAAFHEEELPLLRELADDLAYGITTLRGRQALVDSKRLLDETGSLARVGGWHLDVATRRLHWTDSLYAIHEVGPQFRPTVESAIDFYAPEAVPVIADALQRAIGEGRPFDLELPLVTARGNRLWVRAIGQARKKDGKVIAIDGVFHDITAPRRAKDELRALNEELERRVAERTRQLEEASRAKSDFLANMSHELRTPLNSIIGFSEMLKDGVLGALNDKQRGFAGDIFGAGTHLLALINDILDLSKVEAGAMHLEADAFDLRALLQSSLQMLREKAAVHRIRLEADLDPALGAVFADERKLKQIVYNLLANAVKFTPDAGEVTLRAKLCPRAAVALDGAMPGRLLPLPAGDDAVFLEIAVEDNGVGVAENDLERLFEPFVQVDSSSTRRAGGTGLGLSMVRRLAELHGGTVAVQSRPGAGSRFIVWLPHRSAGAPPRQAPAGEPAREAPAARPLALVIEDDDDAAQLIEAQLQSEGCDTMRAATAEEGLVRAAKRKPDVVTLDIFLPAMDGWEFLRRLKVHDTLREVPVVIVTVAEGAERGLALGARRVLQKPFTREQLAEALAGLVAPRPDGRAPCVLAVDDNPKAVELVATALEADGYRVLRAYGGAEAIAAARQALPDLVILDLMMPEVSGFEVARALRESEATAGIPILVLTAKDLTPEERVRLNGSVCAILEKMSFDADALLVELRRALAGRPAGKG